MSWHNAFEPWEWHAHTTDVKEFIESFGLTVFLDCNDDVEWIDCVQTESGDILYDRGNDDDWGDIENYLPSALVTLLNAVQDWSNPACRAKKRKTIVGSMAILPLP